MVIKKVMDISDEQMVAPIKVTFQTMLSKKTWNINLV